MEDNTYLKANAFKLYNTQFNERENLVKYYTSNGIIRFDIATGLAFIAEDGSIQERVKFIKQFDEFGNLLQDNNNNVLYKTVIDFDEIAKFNISEGISSGTMSDALKKRATGKVVELYANDKCLLWGMILLGTTECLLKIKEDIVLIPYNIMPLYNTFGENIYTIDSYNESSYGLVHSLPNKIERYSHFLRGQYKAYNYRGDAQILNNPISLWSQTDKTTLSTSLFGTNSFIRMYGNNQIIDLNGYEISISECTNIFSPLSSLINLSNGAFGALSTVGCTNAYIYSSANFGRLGRSNHFGILGNFCKNILIENIHIGDDTTKNIGTYFGGILFNTSSEIVVKDVKCEQLNHNIIRSALGLNWYSDLTMNELLLGKLIRVEDWDLYSTYYKWLKWENIEKGTEDIYLNGKQTVYPIIKSIDELSVNIGIEGALRVFESLRASQETYRASMKNMDDVSIQIDVLRGMNFEPLTNSKVFFDEQVARTTNLTAANALNRDEVNLYPESSAYGFRAGSKDVGTGNLAKERIDDAQTNIYLINFEFSTASASLNETVGIISDNILYRAFNDMGLRLFGYSNSRNPSAGVATASMLSSPEYLSDVYGFKKAENLAPGSNPYTIPVPNSVLNKYALNTAEMAFDNSSNEVKESWNNSKNVHGLYKGNDVLENSLSTLTAIGYLYKYFPESDLVLNGINNSKLDIGILSWRKSILDQMNALSANHIGLNGGIRGNISDYNPGQTTENTANEGEIYPWYISKDTIDVLKYNIIIVNSDNLYDTIEFIDTFHNLHVGNEIIIKKNNNTVNNVVIKLISSQKIIINKLSSEFTGILELLYYQGTRLDGTKTPSLIIDKDSDYFNASDKITRNRESVNSPYIASTLPIANDKIFKFKIKCLNELYPENGSIIYLVHVNNDPNDLVERQVTYRECADLLGFDYIGNDIIKDLDEYVTYDLANNIDSQNHVHKGVIGIRLDQIKDSAIIDCNVNKIENTAFFPEVRLIGNTAKLVAANIIQEQRPGSHVNDTHGISINGCENSYIENFSVSDNQSLGNNYGIEINGNTINVDINNINVSNINAGKIYTNADSFNLSDKVYYYSTFPTEDAVGINVKSDCDNIKIGAIYGSEIASPAKNLAQLLRYELN
jgi:hypothetical protein